MNSSATTSELSFKSRAARGALYLVLSTFFFGIASALIKILSAEYSIFEIAFFRNLFGLIPSLWMSRRLGHAGFRSVRPVAHLIRGFYGIASMLLMFYAFALIPLPDATAISFAAPLFITALSLPLLHEKVGSHRWTAVLAGFAGVIVIMKPGSEMLTRGGMAALGAALFHALAMISLRKLRNTENTEVTTLYFTLLATIVTALFVPFYWQTPNWSNGLMLALVGIVSGVGQFCLTKAYGLADASAISPFTYVSIIWATTFGFLIWRDVPTWTTLLGTGIIILSGLYILHRERIRSVSRDQAFPIPEP